MYKGRLHFKCFIANDTPLMFIQHWVAYGIDQKQKLTSCDSCRIAYNGYSY